MIRRRHLTLIEGGMSGQQRRDENAAVYALYPRHQRGILAELKRHAAHPGGTLADADRVLGYRPPTPPAA